MSNYATSGFQPPIDAQPKKKSPLAWILIGCGSFLVLGIIVVAIGGWFVYNKAKEAGLDPELMEKNPAMATAKFITALNPDIEIVSVDDDKGMITFREKKTGKTVTVNLDDAMDGKIQFSEDGKELVTIDANGGESGSVEIKSDKGSVKIGQGSSQDIPAWFPSYPGSAPEGTFSIQTPEGHTTSFRFVTKDSVERVSSFYEDELRETGLKVTTSTTRQAGAMGSSIVTGKERNSGGRTAVVTAISSASGTQVTVNLVSGN